jgi:hypothetical protein
VESKNIVVLLAKTTTATRPTVCQRRRCRRRSPTVDGDVESMALRLIELCRTLPHHSSGRQGGEIHSKLNLHTTKEDQSSTSLISGPILVVAQIKHVLLTGRSKVYLCLIRRQSTIRPGSRLGRTNWDSGARSVASEMAPQPLTVKTHTKHRGPLPKVVAVKGDIREKHSKRRTGRSSSHGGGSSLPFSFLWFFLEGEGEEEVLHSRCWADGAGLVDGRGGLVAAGSTGPTRSMGPAGGAQTMGRRTGTSGSTGPSGAGGGGWINGRWTVRLDRRRVAHGPWGTGLGAGRRVGEPELHRQLVGGGRCQRLDQCEGEGNPSSIPC